MHDEFLKKGAVVIGISKDSAASHARFAEKYSLPFILLSDPDLIAIMAYDVWREKKQYGKVGMDVVRSSFLIDEEGNIVSSNFNVKPDNNAADMCSLL